MAERESQLAAAKFKLEQDKEAREAANDAFEREYKQREQRRADLVAGIFDDVPEQRTVTNVPLPGLLPPRVPRPLSPIRQSMAPDLRNLPVSVTPSAPGMTTQQYSITPGMKGGYYPDLAQKSILQDDKQAADLERERKRLAAQIVMRTITANASKYGADVRAEASKATAKTRAGATVESARIRADASGMGGGGGGRGGGRTSTQAENVRFRYADGLIGTFQSYDEALNYLNSPDGADLRAKGVTPNHLMTAHAAWLKGTTAEALRFERGSDPIPPDEAVDAVTTTRTRISRPPGTPKDTTSGINLSVKDDFTDDEIADALKAGKTTPAEVATYITAKRKSKKKK
jgi:hypothetical protein